MKPHVLQAPTQNVAPRSPTQTENQIGSLRAELDGLEKCIIGLVERIAPVLRTEAPQGATKDGATPQEMLCPVADSIRTQAQRACQLAEHVQRVTERVEA